MSSTKKSKTKPEKKAKKVSDEVYSDSDIEVESPKPKKSKKKVKVIEPQDSIELKKAKGTKQKETTKPKETTKKSSKSAMTWTEHVKAYSKEHGITYKEAQKEAGKTWKKKDGKKA